MTAALILLGAALLLAAAAFVLLRRASAGARRTASSAFLASRLDAAADRGAAERLLRPIRMGGNAWARMLLLAGERSDGRLYAFLLLPPLLAGGLGAAFGGPASAAAAFALLALLGIFRLWRKADKRRRRMINQLPGFLDGVVRLITIGNSVNAAFQGAMTAVDDPLLEVLERADALTRSGKDLDSALLIVSRQYGLQELFLVSSVIALALRFGGRSEQVLERMAAFMRDLEQARDELVALSAEVRLSAWILSLLPIGLALFIIIFNNDLFMNMWRDPVGFRMLMGGLGLQIAGSYCLFRMARGV
ncbi:type II secretion system F family protein [Bordetella pseudohinzii]|uniref:Flp pilus assembly protein TadB n=1 Tax=Bordetella pseudohinzii TaxID=1331258 RepID=A0A0J6C4Y9_9BORD|nr:type II secretion system F family protein [Bordetella pseudohinzii]ANY15264.1 type II secretion protein F [Bordetella pseudohinzii]KMM24337.1 type II secretion protein F [Bordetella pseudohinzii]KXA77818.1 type II secretion protein F [Bordetella pseudohinzii]KXA79536.1 type II secretion protein F [Bordetella pseudohinzii]CUI49211.1 Flp pilus assembly protein TadB [Bordetella pseudohinzii]